MFVLKTLADFQTNFGFLKFRRQTLIDYDILSMKQVEPNAGVTQILTSSLEILICKG